MDVGWRTRIRTMLEKNPTMSFEQIAGPFNKKVSVHTAEGQPLDRRACSGGIHVLTTMSLGAGQLGLGTHQGSVRAHLA
jgi:hypothetical protein